MGKKLSASLLVLLCFLLGISLMRNLTKISTVKKRIEKMRTKIDRLERETQEAEGALQEAQMAESIERQLREKLGLTQEGEIVVVLPDPETLKRLVPAVPQEQESLPDPNWKRWARLFGI